MHFHTVYGFPRHGLQWTEDEHETTGAAWAAVGLVAGENWRQDKAKLDPHNRQHEVVKRAYARAGMLCITGSLGSGASFEIPALDHNKDAMLYGVVKCESAHLQAVSAGEACAAPVRELRTGVS